MLFVVCDYEFENHKPLLDEGLQVEVSQPTTREAVGCRAKRRSSLGAKSCSGRVSCAENRSISADHQGGRRMSNEAKIPP